MNARSHSFDFAPSLAAVLSDARNFSAAVLDYAAQTSVG
jgi:hypothetical protein